MNEVEQMAELFRGYDGAYGTYSREEKNFSKGGKLEIKASARTISSPVTLELWTSHLRGEQPLGIVPIMQDSTCWWAAIDYDKYQITHSDIVKKIEQHGIPMIVCRSKSGGAHIFAFFEHPEVASEIQHAMKGVAAFLGLGRCEIFPKQTSVMYDRGDHGSWLNMPYFGDSDRRAVKSTGLLMTAREFITKAKSIKCTVEQLVEFYTDEDSDKPGSNGPVGKDFSDGPPCLQNIVSSGIEEGFRNNTMLAIAIYAKKKYETGWQEKVAEFNQKFMKNPLSPDEIQQIIKSVSRKDYNYRCKDQPLCDYCNSSVCISRPYGVGDEDMFPQLGGLTVTKGDNPVWFVDVNGERLELSTTQLINYRQFHSVCVERLFTVFPMLKQETWNKILKDAMQHITVLEVPEDATSSGVFKQILEEFCEDRAVPADSPEPLLNGRVWFNEQDDTYVFRLKDLKDFMDNKKFTEFTLTEITVAIRKIGGQSKFFNRKGKGVNAWILPNIIEETPQSELPDHDEEVM